MKTITLTIQAYNMLRSFCRRTDEEGNRWVFVNQEWRLCLLLRLKQAA